MRLIVQSALLVIAVLQFVSCGRDHYKVLNISRNADTTTIKKAYRKLAKEYHPDRNPDDKTAHEKFQEIGSAYEILSNPEKRRNYDRYGDQESEDVRSHGFHHPFAHFGHVPFPMFFGDMFGNRQFQFQQRQRRHEDMMFSFVRGSQGGRFVKIVLFQ